MWKISSTWNNRERPLEDDARKEPEGAARQGLRTVQRGGSFAAVELFTSEGCSSCPPADELLRDIVRDAHDGGLPVFALGFHVDYWDFQGWPDRFATVENSARQTVYADLLGHGNVYTPQMVVNGAVEFVGSRRSEAWAEITAALDHPTATFVELAVRRPGGSEGPVTVTYVVDTAPDNVIVNVAVVESGIVIDVLRGENAGQTLHHDNVVRAFAMVPLDGDCGQVELEFPPDLNPASSSVIAYVQARNTGRIVAAASADLPIATV